MHLPPHKATALKKQKEGEKIAKKNLNKREKLFCLNYALLRNGTEAAARSGYTLNPAAAAVKLLSRADISEETASLIAAQQPVQNETAAGCKRLAFGSVADALSLLFREEPPTKEELSQMDLFNIAEIKRPKGGGMEIKFFDRLKPLERLSEISQTEGSAALPFYEALNSSAKALYGRDVLE